MAAACRDPQPARGALIVEISGLPADVVPDVNVFGPGQFRQTISTTTTLENLAPGTYSVHVGSVTTTTTLYTSTSGVNLTIAAGKTEHVAVQYALGSGVINFALLGVPDGVLAPVRFDGPLARTATASGLLYAMPVGTYTLRPAQAASNSNDLYSPRSYPAQIEVTASPTPVDVTVQYELVSGALAVNVEGLPALPPGHPPITVTGPAGYSRALDASAELRGLTPGTYSIAAAKTSLCPDLYVPTRADTVIVPVSLSAIPASVTYTATRPNPADLNLSIVGMYLVQAVQNFLGHVPIVADRRTLLRVFGVANQCNSATPSVRVALSSGSVITVPAAEASVRMFPEEGVFTASWNVILPPSAVRPGLTVSAEIDPDNEVPEQNEADNSYPRAGALTVDVRTMPTIGVRFVPVVIAGVTGNISPARVDSILAFALKVHPVSAYDADVRASPYTSTHAALTSSDEVGWGSVLSEINAVRVADSSQRYYHGIVHVTYKSGLAGIAFVGGKAGLTWDYLPSGAEVFAHEMGHNFGRLHSPCGNPERIDAGYPSVGAYAGGFIGQFGYDVTENDIKQPTQYADVMGYCNSRWISDYTYSGMLEWILGHSTSLPLRSAAVEPSLLVWGRIVNGLPVLEPAFEIVTRPSLPRADGPYTLDAVDDAGAQLFALSFGAEPIADVSGDQRTFAFAIPMTMLRGRNAAALRLRSAGRMAVSARTSDLAANARATVTRVSDRVARVHWDASVFPAVMIRDADSGDVLSFARGGDATIATGNAASLELLYSNRVRSGRVVVRFR